MYKELEKYKTGKKMPAIGVLPDKQEIDIQLDEYSFGFGELLNDFVNHKNKPFWKRKYYHNHLTKIYLKALNQMEFKIGL